MKRGNYSVLKIQDVTQEYAKGIEYPDVDLQLKEVDQFIGKLAEYKQQLIQNNSKIESEFYQKYKETIKDHREELEKQQRINV